jgi:hypothetical protein
MWGLQRNTAQDLLLSRSPRLQVLSGLTVAEMDILDDYEDDNYVRLTVHPEVKARSKSMSAKHAVLR